MVDSALSEHANQIIANCAAELLQASQSVEGWEDLGVTNDVKSYRRMTDNGIYLVRGEGIINVPAQRILDLLLDADRKKEWDEMYLEGYIVAEIGPGTRILYNRFSAPWPVYERDFVFIGKHQEVDGKIVYVGKSVEVPSIPPKDGAVRGEIHASGFIFEPISENSTRVIYFINVDPKGSIPTMVVNFMSSKQTQNIHRIRTLLESS